ncbi:unnamed protein product [Calypogeia fissa]
MGSAQVVEAFPPAEASSIVFLLSIHLRSCSECPKSEPAGRWRQLDPAALFIRIISFGPDVVHALEGRTVRLPVLQSAILQLPEASENGSGRTGLREAIDKVTKKKITKSDAKLGLVLAFLAEKASGLTVMQQFFTHSRSLLRLCSNFFA